MATPVSTLFGGGRAITTAITNDQSDGGSQVSNLEIGKAALSGALTANTLTAIITFTGRFDIYQLSAAAVDATARTIRLKVTVDGVVVFDATTASISTAGNGIYAAGAYRHRTSPQPLTGEVIRCNSSCVVEVASSLTETDKVRVNYIAHEVQ